MKTIHDIAEQLRAIADELEEAHKAMTTEVNDALQEFHALEETLRKFQNCMKKSVVANLVQQIKDTKASVAEAPQVPQVQKAPVVVQEAPQVLQIQELAPSKQGVQLWKGGPYWADRNVGADNIEDTGLYFWWSDTKGYQRNEDHFETTDAQHQLFEFRQENCPIWDIHEDALRLLGYIDKAGNLTAAYDAATVHLGKPWRLPTLDEFKALKDNCDTEWTQRNGVWGRLVKGRSSFSTKSIFLPAAGYGNGSALYSAGSRGSYWSATPLSGYSNDAWGLYFSLSRFDGLNFYRYYDRPVRAICSYQR